MCYSTLPANDDIYQSLVDDKPLDKSIGRKKEDRQKEKTQLSYILGELIETEKNYVTVLQNLCDAKRKMIDQQIITETDAYRIFVNIDDLFNLHADLEAKLSEKTKKAMKKNTCADIGPVLSEKYVQLIEGYQLFVEGQKDENKGKLETVLDQYGESIERIMAESKIGRMKSIPLKVSFYLKKSSNVMLC